MFAYLLVTALLPTPFGAAPAPVGPHARETAEHYGVVPVLERSGLGAVRQGPEKQRTFTRTVYGYYPYWAAGTELIPWPHLTHLSYFSVEVRSDGTLGSSHGWSTNGGALVAAGHAQGVAVTLTATLFDDAAIGTLLGSTAARDALVQNLLALVQSQGGDGVNIDFESVPLSVKGEFVALMAALSDAFHAAIPGSHVSLASPAVDWTGAYDYDQLAGACDGLLIMGYGYHWSGGDPGPNAPIYSGTTWAGHDLVWTVEDYLTWGGVENRGKFVLGLPLYGMDWPATSAAIPGSASGTGSTRTLARCDEMFAGAESWDEDSATPYSVYVDGGWRQLFCENEYSLGLKMDLVSGYDLGGVMFWAIGYAAPEHPLWAEVDSRFVEATTANRPPTPVARVAGSVVVGTAVVLDGSGSSDPDGQPLSYSWSLVSGAPLVITRADSARALVVPREPGQLVFELVVSDGVASASARASMAVTPTQSIGARSRTHRGCGAAVAAPSALLATMLALGSRRRRMPR